MYKGKSVLCRVSCVLCCVSCLIRTVQTHSRGRSCPLRRRVPRRRARWRSHTDVMWLQVVYKEVVSILKCDTQHYTTDAGRRGHSCVRCKSDTHEQQRLVSYICARVQHLCEHRSRATVQPCRRLDERHGRVGGYRKEHHPAAALLLQALGNVRGAPVTALGWLRRGLGLRWRNITAIDAILVIRIILSARQEAFECTKAARLQ